MSSDKFFSTLLVIVKPLQFMDQTKLIFCSADENHYSEMQLFCNSDNNIFIEVYTPDEPMMSNFIVLNKETAIKLSKHLRREISVLMGVEENDG